MATLATATSLVGADTDPSLKQVQDELATLKEMVQDLSQQRTNDSQQKLHLNGFADVQFRASRTTDTDNQATTDNHFALGQLDLFMTAQLAERTSFMSEVVLEANEQSEVGIDFERLLINFDLHPSLRVSAGRYHTTVGYWNDAYHHGEWLSTSIGRPKAVDFEDGGGILPSHNVGLQAKGAQALGPDWKIDGTIEVGNGRGRAADPPQLEGDSNAGKCLNIQVALSPVAAIPGLRFGGGIYLDRIPENLAPDADNPAHGAIKELIGTAFVTYRRGPWEFLGEYYVLQHTNDDDQTAGQKEGDKSSSTASILQIAYHTGTLTPYLRGDTALLSGRDRYFASTNRTVTGAVGLRWDVNTWTALKTQFQHTRTFAGDTANPLSSTGDSRENALLGQVAVSF